MGRDHDGCTQPKWDLEERLLPFSAAIVNPASTGWPSDFLHFGVRCSTFGVRRSFCFCQLKTYR
jgi:hypothetical protein